MQYGSSNSETIPIWERVASLYPGVTSSMASQRGSESRSWKRISPNSSSNDVSIFLLVLIPPDSTGGTQKKNRTRGKYLN